MRRIPPILIALLLCLPTFASAAEVPTRYTNENYEASHHEAPAYFSVDAFGNFAGETVSGRAFAQTTIANAYDIRLQKFTIDDAYFYITDQGIIHAPSDLAALSIYLARTA